MLAWATRQSSSVTRSIPKSKGLRNDPSQGGSTCYQLLLKLKVLSKREGTMSSRAGNFPTDLKIKYNVFIKSLPLCWGMRHCLLVEHLPSMHRTLDSKQWTIHQELNQTDTMPHIHSGMLFSLDKPCLGNNKKYSMFF